MAVEAAKQEAQALTGSFPVRLVKAYGQSKAGYHAAGLAFKGFMTMFPLMLGILVIVGLVIRNPHLEAQVRSTMVSAFPADAHDTLNATLTGIKRRTGILAVLSVGGLIWTGTGLFAFLEFVLNEMFGARQRDFVHQRLMGLLMVAVFVVAVVLAVLANAAVSFAPKVPFLGPVVGAIAMVAMMTVIFRVVPHRTFSLREVWKGALLSGVGMEILTLAFPLYTRLVHGFNTYGATFALFFLLATWLYFVSQLIVLGAVLNRMLLGSPEVGGAVPARHDPPVATEGAEAVEEQRQAVKRSGGPSRKLVD
ncbi:MAG: YihY/virulence factor BrkB family protein [Candidatus Dormibacteraeota bacterium]|nr:YihY/virulence factor BrkB family protein [Candidatus Dormibacteraeota bacterium]